MNLETNRIILRLAEAQDCRQLLAFVMDNDEYFKMWGPEKEEGYFTEEFWLQKIQKAREEFIADKSCNFIVLQKDTSTIIGMVNFTNIIRGPLQHCFLGYKIAHAFQNQGYATEAINLGISYVFKKLNIRRISANYMPRNTASARVLEKLGFEKEGLARKYLRINGEWEDHILTSKINEDWAAYDSLSVTIGKGSLSGKGVYANKDIKKDEVVIKYKLKPLNEKEYSELPEEEKMFTHIQLGQIYLYSEPERYVNSASNPNTYQDLVTKCDIALRDIKKGEMITSDATKDDIYTLEELLDTHK